MSHVNSTSAAVFTCFKSLVACQVYLLVGNPLLPVFVALS